jgi:hypothetical protein
MLLTESVDRLRAIHNPSATRAQQILLHAKSETGTIKRIIEVSEMSTPMDIKRAVEFMAIQSDALWACRFAMSAARQPEVLSAKRLGAAVGGADSSIRDKASGRILVRDSTNPDSARLAFSAREWREFAARIKSGHAG